MSMMESNSNGAAAGAEQLRGKRLSFVIIKGGAFQFVDWDDATDDKHGIFSMKDPLNEVFGKTNIDVERVEHLCIRGQIANLIQKQPSLMGKLLEEIPETLPNLKNFDLNLPHRLPIPPKILLYLDTYILEPFMGDQPTRVNARGDRGNIILSTNNFEAYIYAGHFRNESEWYNPLLELVLQKPNLEFCRIFAIGSDLNLLYHICSSSSLEDLRIEGLTHPGLDTGNWLPLLLAAITDCKQQAGKKRKRRRRDNGLMGGLYQLQTLELESFNLQTHSHLLSLSETTQANKHLTTLDLDQIVIQEHHAQVQQGMIEITEEQLWEPFLDILRHNKTLTDLNVSYVIPYDSVLWSMERDSPYWEGHLSDILVDCNHKISSISFGYKEIYGHRPAYIPDHPDTTQLRLDINYFGLGRFGIVANANQEGFRGALIAAVQKNDTTQKGDRKLIPCLFQLITNNPFLLINNLD